MAGGSDRYRMAIGERLSVELPPGDAPVALQIDGGQIVSVAFAPDAASATVSAAIDLPADGLSAAVRGKLLAYNLPAADTAGALVQPDGEGGADLVNVVPLAAVSPQALAGIVVNQARAARRLSAALAG